jgi:hypothetical protein
MARPGPRGTLWRMPPTTSTHTPRPAPPAPAVPLVHPPANPALDVEAVRRSMAAWHAVLGA